MRAAAPVAIADLLAAGLRPEPHEAVTIVLEICRQVIEQGPRAGVAAPISTATVAIDPSGAVVSAGGAPAEDDQTVLLLGHLLLEMLGPPDTAPGARVPAKLRAIAVRASSGAPESYPSVGSLAAALRRFGAVKAQAAVRAVYDRWQLSSSGKVAAAAGRGTPGPSGRAERGIHVIGGTGGDTARVHAVPLSLMPPERNEEWPGPNLGRPSRAQWLATALVAGAAVLLLVGGMLFWFTDVELPIPIHPSARPVPVAPPPGRELLQKPNRAPTKAVKVNASGRSEAVRAPAEPAVPERTP